MDLILYFLIVLFGLIPPIAVGVWSYYQGKKGYEEAIDSRNQAFITLDSMNVKMEDAFSKLDKLPTSEVMLDKIQKSVQGSYGQLIKGSKAEMEKMIDETAESAADQMTPEQRMAAIGQRVQMKIMDKMGDFLS